MPVQTRSQMNATTSSKQNSNGVRTRAYAKKELNAATTLASMKHGNGCCSGSVNSDEKESSRPRRSCANY